MVQEYTGRLLCAIQGIIRLRWKDSETRYVVLVLLCRFMGCQSLYDLSQTFCIPKKRVYGCLRGYRAQRILDNQTNHGFHRLRDHLRKLAKASPATRSREAVLICTDDSTRETRGSLGNTSGLHFNGEAKRVTLGHNLQLIVAVIGEGLETIILDACLFPPKPEGAGRRPTKRTVWFAKRLVKLEARLRSQGVSLKGCTASMDSAYASRHVKETLDRIGMPMVSRLHSSRVVGARLLLTIRVWAPVRYFFGLWNWLHPEEFKPLTGSPGVEYQRVLVESKALGPIVAIIRKTEGELTILFSTNPQMKAITIHRAAVRRWRLERVFWSLKQEIGWKSIHQQDAEVVKIRVFLCLVVYQALLDTARAVKKTPGVRTGNSVAISISSFPKSLMAALFHGRKGGNPHRNMAFQPGEKCESKKRRHSPHSRLGHVANGVEEVLRWAELHSQHIVDESHH